MEVADILGPEQAQCIQGRKTLYMGTRESKHAERSQTVQWAGRQDAIKLYSEVEHDTYQ